MPKSSGETTVQKAEDDPQAYTRLFMTGLRMNLPWGQLVTMQLPRLVMMIDAAFPAENGSRKAARNGVREATQADIDALLN